MLQTIHVALLCSPFPAFFCHVHELIVDLVPLLLSVSRNLALELFVQIDWPAEIKPNSGFMSHTVQPAGKIYSLIPTSRRRRENHMGLRHEATTYCSFRDKGVLFVLFFQLTWSFWKNMFCVVRCRKFCGRDRLPENTSMTLGYFRRLLMGLPTVLCPCVPLRCWHLLYTELYLLPLNAIQ